MIFVLAADMIVIKDSLLLESDADDCSIIDKLDCYKLLLLLGVLWSMVD